MSSKPTLLVTGISGFLGSYVPDAFGADWHIHGFYFNSPVQHALIETSQVNLLDWEQFSRAATAIQPTAVLHLAAQANPNYCETHPEESELLNLKIPVRLAQWCGARHLPFLSVSSDLVFDGSDAPYAESATPQPINLYGQHKAAAEAAILQAYRAACVVRCPVMYGLPRWGSSFMSGWISALRDGKKIYAFEDEFRTKIDGRSAAEGLALLLLKNAQGIYHISGGEPISRFDFAMKMAAVFDLPTSLIIASKRADVSMPAARPADVSLSMNKLTELGFSPPGILEILQLLKIQAAGY